MSKAEIARELLALAPEALAVVYKSARAIARGESADAVLTQAEKDLLAAAMLQSFDRALGLEPEES